MMIDIDNDSLVYLLGYLTPEQWVDAMGFEDEDEINRLLDAVDRRYTGIRAAVDDVTKGHVVKRLSGE